MVDITEVSAVVAAMGVLVGVVLTVLELRHLAKSRRTDSVWRVISSFNSRDFLEAYMKVLSLDFKDYDDFTRRYGDLRSGKCEVGVPFRMVCNLFETVGFLFHNGLIEYEVVSQFPVTVAWEKVKPIVEGFRKKFNFPQSFEWFEYVYNEMKKREQQMVS